MFGRKMFCEEVPSVSISKLAKRGLLDCAGVMHAQQCGRPTRQLVVIGWASHVTLNFLNSAKTEPQVVELEYTPNNYGGKRPWFLCPSCDKRCAFLYCHGSFACRACHDLRYEVQYQRPDEKAVKRIRKLRHKLGADGDVDNETGPKPKFMHASRHAKLLGELEAQESRYVNALLSGSFWGGQIRRF